MSVRREIEVQATPEEVWEALATEEGRDRWLEEPDRQIHVELLDAPHRLAWWWASADEPATRVEFRVLAVSGDEPAARVIVIESAPSFPLAMLAASFTRALA